MPRRCLLGLALLAALVSGACIESPHDACHRRALEALGCCPFHSDECQGGEAALIKEACAKELGDAEDEVVEGDTDDSDGDQPAAPDAGPVD